MDKSNLRKQPVSNERFGSYTRVSSIAPLNGWRVSAENIGPAGASYGVYVDRADCNGGGFHNLGHVAGGRGCFDRIAELATRVIPTLVHVPDLCSNCNREAPYRVQHGRTHGVDGQRYYVLDVAADEPILTHLTDAQACHVALAAHLAALVTA